MTSVMRQERNRNFSFSISQQQAQNHERGNTGFIRWTQTPQHHHAALELLDVDGGNSKDAQATSRLRQITCDV